MKRMPLFLTIGLACVLASAAGAQKPTPKAHGMSRPGTHRPMAAATKVTGPVKGMPTGNTFVVAVPRKGPITVDAAHAKVRMRGKFASLKELRGGAMVTVTGMMSGPTLMASDVDIRSLPGKTKAMHAAAHPMARAATHGPTHKK